MKHSETGSVPASPIAALCGSDSVHAQALMRAFAQELTQSGARVAGVTQMRVERQGKSRIVLRDLVSGVDYEISQDLGPGSSACNLDAGELAMACAAIEQAVREGAQLVVLSKFAKQEAARGGLCDAFRAAMSRRIPIVTAVSPHFRDEWRSFAGPLARDIATEAEALRQWWRTVEARTP